MAIYNRLPDHANRLAPNPNSHAPFYTDEQLGIFPRYQLLRQFDVDLQEVSLEGIESLNAARDALAATAESSLRTELGRISGEIPRRVMEEEYELFVDFIRLLTEDELLTVTPLRSHLGGPTSDTGEEYSREISAVVALDMTREGATLAREVIVETLDALGVNYTETLPGLWTLRLASAADFGPIPELLEDASMDASDHGRWPSGTRTLYMGPSRLILSS